VVEVAVPSYLGLQMMIGQNGHPVTLTRITPHRAATTSLRLPLTVLGPSSTLTAGSLCTPPPPALSSTSRRPRLCPPPAHLYCRIHGGRQFRGR
jgi:hypothetical protein